MSYNYNANTKIKHISIFSGMAKESVSDFLNNNYKNITTNLTDSIDDFNNIIDLVAKWFLHMSSMSNKKLQKLCYYAYCWYIVFFNDIESIIQNELYDIQILWDECFQAWIHGPVLPSLYFKYDIYGWHDIPKINQKIIIPDKIEELLLEVWDIYAIYSADELEAISQEEEPWKKARGKCANGKSSANEISVIDILEYYSKV